MFPMAITTCVLHDHHYMRFPMIITTHVPHDHPYMFSRFEGVHNN